MLATASLPEPKSLEGIREPVGVKMGRDFGKCGLAKGLDVSDPAIFRPNRQRWSSTTMLQVRPN